MLLRAGDDRGALPGRILRLEVRPRSPGGRHARRTCNSGVFVSIIEPGPIRTRFVVNAIARLKANIDIEGSPHREKYVERLAAMEAGGSETFKLEPAAVSKRLVQALESRRPRRRYYVTTPTYLAAIGRRVLPPAAIEYLSMKF